MGKPHGLGGAFVVEDASDEPTRFEVGSTLLVGGEPVTVTESKRAGNRLVVRLDRRVERGATLEIPRSTLPEAGDDSYYVFQLVGLEVVEEGGVAQLAQLLRAHAGGSVRTAVGAVDHHGERDRQVGR